MTTYIDEHVTWVLQWNWWQCNKMIENVAIIGAGPAGLCCAKNSIDYGHNVIVYEQNSKLGGQWVYSEKDENDGIPVHSSIYKGLL